MKNNILFFFLILFFKIIFLNISSAQEQFKFNITEIEISENGNLIIGSKGGVAETYDGHEIIAENFVYNKSKNILNATGNVKFIDNNTNLIVFSDRAKYLKNDEIIITNGNSKAISQDSIITSTNFKLDITKNILIANSKVKYLNKKDDFTILSNKATYKKNDEIIFTEGDSSAIYNDYKLTASNFKFDKIKNIVHANNNVEFVDKENNISIYSDEATYQKNNEIIFTKGSSKAVSEKNIITASNFKFDRNQNILIAENEVEFIDEKDDFTILSDKAIYQKNNEIILTYGNSKAFNKENNITASNFIFDKINDILNANKNVKFEDKKRNTIITTEKATYRKKEEIVFTEGDSKALIENRYNFLSSNVNYNKIKQQISSQNKSKIIEDNGNIYEANNFLYEINTKILKAKNVNLTAQIDKNKKDNYFFSEGFFNFAKKKFLSKETKVNVHKSIFENNEQDPRLYGSSSFGDQQETVVNNGIFTSCKINDSCPPWSIQSEKITHDKVKKNLIYKNAILKVYDVPVLYFPKFFHPDPTVKRRSGFLQPQFNSSKTLGSSLYLPYFKTLGVDKDYTFKPTVFEDKYILQNEFRRETKYSSLITDFALTRGYKPSSSNKKKNINHLFLNYKKNLNLDEFNSSELDFKIERVNNDTYLKVFQNNLFPSPVMPGDKNKMESKINFDFDHDDYNLSARFQVFENLGQKHSDRYQYVLPSYDFSKNLKLNNFKGSASFYSSGSNNLKDTNNLRTSITNDLEYRSVDFFTNNGIKNNLNLYFKNFNSVGKNDTLYKSSPSIDGHSIFEVFTTLPLIKNKNTYKEILTPKISLRANPFNNMNNHSDSSNLISANNVFDINRLGVTDSFEAGKSITLGIDYKLDYIEGIGKTNIEDEKEGDKDKFLEFTLATVFRDAREKNIPTSSTIDEKSSNLFGSINNNLLENINIGYDFSLDNDLNTFESHSINTEISINNFVTEFNFLEQRNELGSNHLISNITTYNFNNNNSLTFSTRRNKEISLTEFYDFSYEYKNDCLTAAIKYNKTFYQDNDLRPEENLFFTITLIPLTTYERRLYERTN